ncbi:MAG: DUF1624 domain-containing protein, partial [Candidatus Hodarchaeota archaeon]
METIQIVITKTKNLLVQQIAELKAESTRRILALDFVRGLAVVLMALDHTSLFWDVGHIVGEGLHGYRPIPLDLLHFLVRFITHYCAPTFVFLAGTGIVLFEANRLKRGKTQREITQHLFIRGLVLLMIEWTVIAFIFRAAPFYFGVLAAIAVGFVIFAFLRRFSSKIIFIFSLVILLSPIIEFLL